MDVQGKTADHMPPSVTYSMILSTAHAHMLYTYIFTYCIQYLHVVRSGNCDSRDTWHGHWILCVAFVTIYQLSQRTLIVCCECDLQYIGHDRIEIARMSFEFHFQNGNRVRIQYWKSSSIFEIKFNFQIQRQVRPVQYSKPKFHLQNQNRDQVQIQYSLPKFKIKFSFDQINFECSILF